MSKRAHFTIERNYAAPAAEVWELWTTKAGIESWWGPEGFTVTVTTNDLKPGGQLVYLMTATAPPQIAFMKQHGLPQSTECKVTYTEVSAPHRLGYETLTDFVPGVPPYTVATTVDFRPVPGGVMLTLTSQALHDDMWTERARAGHESQLRKLDALLASQGKRVQP